MAAVAYERSGGRRLRLVTDDEARLVQARRRRHELMLVRRRAATVAVVVALLVALGMLLGRTSGHAGMPADGPAGVREDASAGPLPVTQRAYVVQPGDTVWRIARALQPTGDVRPLVLQLERARHGAPLRVGERIALP